MVNTMVNKLPKNTNNRNAVSANQALLNEILTSQEVLSVKQAAIFLSLSPRTIYSYISHRKIPYTKRNGSVWLLRSKLLEWLHDGERKTLNQMSR
jgi:excisionase family DNA binding protein